MKLKLIEQMRLVAAQCSDMWAQEKFTELIDRLAASGALVPVAKPRCGYEEWNYDTSQLKVYNDVALVPIMEAEI